MFRIPMEQPVISIKQVGESKSNFIVKTWGDLNLLRIEEINRNNYTLTHVLECKELFVHTHSLQVDVTGAFLNIATTQNKIKGDELENNVIVIRVPIV